MLRRRAPQSVSGAASSVDMLVVGLGNPGSKYDHTRHNVGADAVKVLAARLGARLSAQRVPAMSDRVRIASKVAVIAVPTTYMNESGQAVAGLMRMCQIDDPAQLLIVHDELDLEPGIVRVKVGGGLAGHNGLRSITQHLGTQDYLRVRIGIGKPPGGKEQGARHVLNKVAGAARETLGVTVERAADAVELIVSDGPEAAMRSINARQE